MIIVKIKAGLGNQMFQYALGRRLSLDWHDELKLDLSWFENIKKNETARELDINKLNTTISKASEEEILKAQPNIFKKIFVKINSRLNKSYFYTFFPNVLKKKKVVYLDGYFQSYKYFDSIRETLLKDFTLKDGFSAEAVLIKNQIEQAGQSVAMHIRRGDYVVAYKDWHGSLDTRYYEAGLADIKKKHPNVTLFIFSDDIEWAKQNLRFENPIVFVSRPGLQAIEELQLMSLCTHQVIANSSFSWWGAWLNKNPEKIVVAPKQWLAAADINTKDLLPLDWVRC